METKHTPGPWNADGCKVKGPHGNIVAETFGYSDKAATPEQRAQGGRESNARIIAAAPELLDLLRRIYDADRCPGIVNGEASLCRSFHEAAKRLIAKATGETA